MKKQLTFFVFILSVFYVNNISAQNIDIDEKFLLDGKNILNNKLKDCDIAISKFNNFLEASNSPVKNLVYSLIGQCQLIKRRYSDAATSFLKVDNVCSTIIEKTDEKIKCKLDMFENIIDIVEELQDKVDLLDKYKTSNDDKIKLETKLKDAEAQQQKDKNYIDSLKNEIEIKNGEIATFNSKIEEINTAKIKLEGRVSELENENKKIMAILMIYEINESFNNIKSQQEVAKQINNSAQITCIENNLNEFSQIITNTQSTKGSLEQAIENNNDSKQEYTNISLDYERALQLAQEAETCKSIPLHVVTDTDVKSGLLSSLTSTEKNILLVGGVTSGMFGVPALVLSFSSKKSNLSQQSSFDIAKGLRTPALVFGIASDILLAGTLASFVVIHYRKKIKNSNPVAFSVSPRGALVSVSY